MRGAADRYWPMASLVRPSGFAAVASLISPRPMWKAHEIKGVSRPPDGIADGPRSRCNANERTQHNATNVARARIAMRTFLSQKAGVCRILIAVIFTVPFKAASTVPKDSKPTCTRSEPTMNAYLPTARPFIRPVARTPHARAVHSTSRLLVPASRDVPIRSSLPDLPYIGGRGALPPEHVRRPPPWTFIRCRAAGARRRYRTAMGGLARPRKT